MSRLEPITVLIHEWATGGLAGENVPDSWRAEGRAMRRSIAADFAAIADPPVRVVVSLGGSEPDEPGDWRTPRTSASQGVEGLIGLSKQADYTLLIAPETRGILATLVRALNQAGVRLLNCDPEAIELTGDKLRFRDWLDARGIPTPACRLIRAGESIPKDGPFPAVLKPIDGAGSLDTYLLVGPGPGPWPETIDADMLLQPYHAGVAMSASFLVSHDGTPWLIGLGRQTMLIRQGRFMYRGGEVPASCPEALPALRRGIDSVPGLRGFVGVDFLWDSDRRTVMVLEINPRATTSFLGLSRLLPSGRLAQAWLAACGARSDERIVLASLAQEVALRPTLRFDVEGRFKTGSPR